MRPQGIYPPAPAREYSWTERLVPTAQALLHSGRLKCEGLLGPVVRLEEAAQLYMDISSAGHVKPDNTLKIGIDHTLPPQGAAKL